FPQLNVNQAKVQVARTFRNAAGDSITLTYDSTRSKNAVDTAGRYHASPIIAVDFPLFLRADRLRFAAGLDLSTPTRDWYAGISLLQLTSGFRQEDTGIDLILASHFGKRDILENPTQCAAGTETCNTTTKGYAAFSALFLLNGATVVDKLLSALGFVAK